VGVSAADSSSAGIARPPVSATITSAATRTPLISEAYSGRSTSGNFSQTGTPQKWSPSVQVGVVRW